MAGGIVCVMNARPTADSLLRRMHLAGYAAAAAAGALTVGLIGGIANTAQPSWSTTGTAKAATAHGDDDGWGDDDDNRAAVTTGQQQNTANANGGVAAAPQNQAPVGGSHGS